MKNTNIKKILVIRLSSMGDIILTSALIRNLKTNFPDAEIDFVLAKEYEEIYLNNPHIRNIYNYDKSWKNNDLEVFKSKILSENYGLYDLVIDLQKNLRSYFLKKDL